MGSLRGIGEKARGEYRYKLPFTKDDKFPFEIPDNWVWVRLGDISSKITDGSHNPPPNNLSGIPILSAANIFGGTIQFSSASRWISEEQWEIENKRTEIQINDILLTIVGTIGRTAIVKSNNKFALQRSVGVIKSILVFPEYISYALQSTFLLDLMVSNSKGTAQKGIYLNAIKELIIPLPPLSEQHRIVAKIEELLPFIDQYAKKEQELTALHQAFPDKLKKSILQAAIQGKLTEQNPNDEPAIELVKHIQQEKERLISEKKLKKTKRQSEIIMRDNIPYEIIDGVEHCIADEVPFEIPENWCWVRLNQLGILVSGHTPKAKQLAHTGEIPYFKVSDMNTDGNEKYLIHTNKFLSKNYSGKTYPENSIVFPKNGGAVFTNKKRILKSASLVDLNTGIFIPFEINYFNYIFMIFNTIDFKKHYKGTALPTVDLNLIGNLIFPLPPLSEQKQIVNKIEILFSSLDKLK
ncbi:restriction endonuclease subunit S [Rodentibacter abscessus]|uniref:restriction endonuclease subunit S n=1 Tax=Rodentibacter abscessus TaxID=3381777 RepID=UPI00399C9AB9